MTVPENERWNREQDESERPEAGAGEPHVYQRSQQRQEREHRNICKVSGSETSTGNRESEEQIWTSQELSSARCARLKGRAEAEARGKVKESRAREARKTKEKGSAGGGDHWTQRKISSINRDPQEESSSSKDGRAEEDKLSECKERASSSTSRSGGKDKVLDKYDIDDERVRNEQ